MTSQAPRLPFSLDPLIAEAKRQMRRRRLLVAALLLTAAGAGWLAATRSPGGPGSGPPAVRGALSGSGRAGAIRISPAGAIGPLHMNRSTHAQVIAYAGSPDLDRFGSSFRRYEVLGYACDAKAGTEKNWAAYPVQCRTAFYLVRGRLSLFFTTDPRFAESAGVRIGTPTRQAERLLHRKAIAGCVESIGLGGKRTSMVVSVDGRKTQTVGTSTYVLNGSVDAFYLHGALNPGATDCD
jgi:hypothetical protein